MNLLINAYMMSKGWNPDLVDRQIVHLTQEIFNLLQTKEHLSIYEFCQEQKILTLLMIKCLVNSNMQSTATWK